MVDKFGRNYVLEVRGESGLMVTIQPPFTIEFDIIRNSLSSANISSIRIYNLAELTRNLIRKDRNSIVVRDVILAAGYGDVLPIVFNGNVSQAWSVREGSNFITQIECYDGGSALASSGVSMQFPQGTAYKTIIGALITTLPGIKIGKIGDFTGTIPRGNSYSGGTIDILNQLTGNGFFIDNQVANALKDSEVLDDPPYLINSSTGLLGTPIREEQYLVFDIIFEPHLKIGQEVLIDSSTNKNFNSIYKIVSIKHHAVISESICGIAKTTIGVHAPTLGV